MKKQMPPIWGRCWMVWVVVGVIEEQSCKNSCLGCCWNECFDIKKVKSSIDLTIIFGQVWGWRTQKKSISSPIIIFFVHSRIFNEKDFVYFIILIFSSKSLMWLVTNSIKTQEGTEFWKCIEIKDKPCPNLNNLLSG